MEKTIRKIEEHKVVTICRGVYGDDLKNLVTALYDGGIRLVEVTFDQSDSDSTNKTADAIRMIHENFPEILVGCGTATKIEHVHATKAAGGVFVLSPNVNKEVIKATKEQGLVSIPGALTPSEIMDALEYGADIVKVFPAGWLGIDYIKNVKGPINHAKFMAAAGINEENINEFSEAGYCSFGISGRLVDRKLISEGNFKEITNRARVFVDNVR